MTRPARCPRPAALALLGGLGIAVAAAGCGGASRPGSASRDAVILLTCNVPEASVFIDGRFLAPVGLLGGGVAVSPGEHRLELRHDGYLGRFIELSLGPAERRRVDARLFPILP